MADEYPRIHKQFSGQNAEIEARLCGHLLDKDAIMASLPAVGDELMRKPMVYGVGAFQMHIGPQRCVVTYVNREHLWYEVQFKKTGFKECYKLPVTKKRRIVV